GADIDAGHATKPGTTMPSAHDSGSAAPADSGHADASTAPAADASSTHPHDAGMRRGLRGAFLELSNDHPASLYRDAITEMAELGMDTAIVQTESYLEQPSFARNPVDR